VNVESFDQCPRYSALVFENVTVKPSPLWLQYRLQSIGLNPINNIVDVTNFVMSELAQPMHAFDADKVQGHTIFIRQAKNGESFTALNDEQYELAPSNMVIADEAGPIALAGVIGGRNSAISASTTRIILESACFNAVSVRKTSSAIKLRTDASMRFEKSQDPANTVRGLARAIALLREVSPGIQIAGGLSDSYRPLKSIPPIELPLDWLDRKLGRALPAAEVKSILEALEFGVAEPSPRILSVTVPSWRATKDISIKDDLVEEAGRMVGYESITPAAPSLAVTVPPRNHERIFHHFLRQMTAAQGFDEVHNYSFLSEDLTRKFDFDPGEHVAVKNPIAADQSLMRISLVPGIWKNIVQNAKYFESFRLFEIGKEIHKRPGDLPLETTRIAAAIYAKGDGVAELFELKRLAECLAPGIEVKPVFSTRNFEHPARTVDVIFKETTIGRLFEMHPSFVEHGRAAILDINVDQLGELRATDRRYQAIQRYPSSAFDLSVVTRIRQPIGDIQQLLAPLAGPNLQQIEFVRQYTGPQLAEGTKSVTFRFTLASPDRTLSAEEVAVVREQIIEGMQALGYELRV
jgi:phenylalanyl-tRNA synthetase beta chain